MSTFHIAMFVKAKTPEELMLEMVKNNNRNGITFKYHSIQHVNKYWYAWYDGDATLMFKKQMSMANVRTTSEDN